MVPPAGSEGLVPQEAHLREYLLVISSRRRLVLAVFLGVTVVAAVRALLTRPVYEATAQILIERDTPSVLSFKEVAQVDAARDDYYQTQYTLLRSRALARRVVEGLDLLQDAEHARPMEAAIDTFLERLRVVPVRNSRLVTVSYSSHRPELAAAVANKLSQLYIEQTLELRYQASSEAAGWLGRQIEEHKRRAEAADRALQAVKEREGIVNIEERRTLLEQKLKELGSALTGRRTERLEKEALYAQMRSARHPEELPEVMRSPLVQSLRIELAGLEREQARILERFMDQHPEVVKVRKQIQETRNRIAGESQRVIRAAQNDTRAAAAQEASVAAALEAAKAEALDLSRRSVAYDTAKREAEAGQEVLTSLLARHKQTDVAQELRSSNIRIVDPAGIPRKPVKPNVRRDTLLGLALGFFLAVGMAFFIDYLDNSVKTADDVRTALGAPLLGMIPEVPARAGSAVLRPSADSALGEGYRLLRTALTYSWPDSGSRLLLVTSTSAGEGKTVTSVNLAHVLASLGGKVLLVDGDLRKPQGHLLLKARRTPGLSDVIVGVTRPSEAIQRPRHTTLSFLAAGSYAPSPADLLTTQAMRGFLQNLRGFYDWIVLDTPPVGPVAEALILAPLTDGVVVVVGAERVTRGAVRHTLERIGATGARVLGVVLNRARSDRQPAEYEHHYRHDYGSYGQAPRAVSATVTPIYARRAAR